MAYNPSYSIQRDDLVASAIEGSLHPDPEHLNNAILIKKDALLVILETLTDDQLKKLLSHEELLPRPRKSDGLAAWIRVTRNTLQERQNQFGKTAGLTQKQVSFLETNAQTDEGISQVKISDVIQKVWAKAKIKLSP